MKFSKFVKSLAPDGGAIYEYMDERWLASPSVLMLIPDGIRSVTGYSNEKMPDGIGRLISQVGCTEYATLVKAIMPEPDGAIKDCVRIFATQDSTMTLPITNDDWSLIEFQSTRPVWGATANLTILPRQICTKGTKEFLLGRKTHGKKEK